ncbi:MAG: gephyrin-like molybdotransferase Glp [Terriglobia bacterium]
MPPLSFNDARSAVLARVQARMGVELAGLADSDRRILAEDAAADRDYPPFDRSARDGFAIRAADVPGLLRKIGEVRAGETSEVTVGPGEAMEIMTGAPVPAGADAVIMIEHCSLDSDTVRTSATIAAGANIAPRGSEAKAGSVVLNRGARIDYSGIAWLAATGHTTAPVFAKPRVAIIATGDEIVEADQTPLAHQIRNSNAWSLAAQVRRAGGIPVVLPIARDDRDTTRLLIEQGLEADLLLLSGGVSAGKYDVVEPALADLGAEIYFDRVNIQPGQPVVFGHVRDRFFFGLPGNPASTMVTFELFARAAIELLGGANEARLDMPYARLTRAFRHKAGLTRFLPALVSGGEVTPVGWQGSGDVAALCRANAYLVAELDQTEYAAGEFIRVIAK